MATDVPTRKVAVITGASSGIGREVALALARAGWTLVLFSRRTNLLEETRLACPDPDACLVTQGDVCSEEDVVRLFQLAVERFGMFSFAKCSGAKLIGFREDRPAV